MRRAALLALLLVAIAASAAGAGCAHVRALPTTDAEWRLSLGDLETDYPDLKRFGTQSGSLRRVASFEFFGPPMSEVVESWGEPQFKYVSLWNLKGFFIPVGTFWVAVAPNSVWVWIKGNYKIEAVVTWAAERLYSPELWYLRIEEFDIEELKRNAPKELVEAALAGQTRPVITGGPKPRDPYPIWLSTPGLEIFEGKDGLVVRPIQQPRRVTVQDFSNAYAYMSPHHKVRVRMTRCDRCQGDLRVPDAKVGGCRCKAGKK